MSCLRNLPRALAVAALSAVLLAPASVARAEPSLAELTRRIEKSSIELEWVVESYNKLTEDMKANQATATTLASRIRLLEARAAHSQADVGEIAVRAYKAGRLNTANVLLQPGGPAALLDRLGTLDQLTRQRQQRIADFIEHQRRLVDQKRRLELTVAKQSAQARQLAATRTRIERDLAKLYELRRQAYGRATEPPRPAGKSAGAPPAVSDKAGVAVRYAYGALGKPYVWAADGPDGYDCSGLTSAAWRAAGKSLPHNARMQWGVVSHISRSQLRPGDLVFYRNLGHVALYVGDGQVIHAPTFGRNVEKRNVDLMPPYGYGRVR